MFVNLNRIILQVLVESHVVSHTDGTGIVNYTVSINTGCGLRTYWPDELRCKTRNKHYGLGIKRGLVYKAQTAD